MTKRQLVEAFNECVDRLQTNRPINYGDYPGHESQLELMIAVGQTIGQMMGSAEEVRLTQSRARVRLERELSTLNIKRRSGSIRRLIAVATLSLMVLTLVLGGLGAVLAQNSLPGDRLYDLKLFTEDVRLRLSTNDESLKREFAQRRIDETRTLLEQGREEYVTFEGVVQAVSADTIQVSGLVLDVSSLLDLPPLMPESRIKVTAITTKTGQLIGEAVLVLDEPEIPIPVPMATPTVTPSAVPTAHVEPTETMTLTPTATLEPPPGGDTPPEAEPTQTDDESDLPEPSPTSPTVAANVVGEAGCTPGFWRQENHFEFWVGYSPDDSVVIVLDRDVETLTLEEAVQVQGGGLNALLRHTIAALLNASNPDVAYVYNTEDVLTMFQAAFDSGEYEVVKDNFDAANNAGCPLGEGDDDEKDVGPPDHAGPPDHTGKPDQTGPPSDNPGAK